MLVSSSLFYNIYKYGLFEKIETGFDKRNIKTKVSFVKKMGMLLLELEEVVSRK